MKTYVCPSGLEIFIDDCDERILEHKWYAVGGYACRRVVDASGAKHWLGMHREIMGLKFGDPQFVDHKSGVRSDNRRTNLRLCTHSENARNAAYALGASGVRGVYACGSRWQAKILIGNRVRHLGLFASKEAAGEFRQLVADMLRGEFAEHRRTGVGMKIVHSTNIQDGIEHEAGEN